MPSSCNVWSPSLASCSGGLHHGTDQCPRVSVVCKQRARRSPTQSLFFFVGGDLWAWAWRLRARQHASGGAVNTHEAKRDVKRSRLQRQSARQRRDTHEARRDVKRSRLQRLLAVRGWEGGPAPHSSIGGSAIHAGRRRTIILRARAANPCDSVETRTRPSGTSSARACNARLPFGDWKGNRARTVQ